ncbi:glycerophosphodiester phosphodiesterase family protein [Neotamlana nanhaiensis]|uniref:glycerophosphodiester phosphodiesterase family protein n=1 Tax=Neotamlana nanhaiensis TaxID=1382798 RepID=UPI00069A71B4|nr:glycerophosphodiester phosphodiesterase family protein [Tamlana nanhaiensis]
MKYLNKTIICSLIALLLFNACSKDDNGGAQSATLNAVFSLSVEEALVGETIKFTNQSTGTVNSALWDFGDGTTATTNNPAHTFSKLGNYTVSLTVKNDSQEKSTSKEIVISLSETISGRQALLEKLNGLNGKMLVCAHRGLMDDAPENSLKAIQDAIDKNMAMVEIDVRQTKDGELVVMHDATIDRTTNGAGKVSDYLLAELQQFNLYKSNGVLSTEKIPTLNQALELARGNVYIDLDIDKRTAFNKVHPLVKQYGMVSQVLFCSSELSEIKEMVKVDNVLALPIVRNNNFSEYASLNLSIVQFNVDNDAVAQSIQNKNWKIFRLAYVNTNTTPTNDNYGQLNEIIDLKGSVVQTDHPLEIKSKLQSLNLNN